MSEIFWWMNLTWGSGFYTNTHTTCIYFRQPVVHHELILLLQYELPVATVQYFVTILVKNKPVWLFHQQPAVSIWISVSTHSNYVTILISTMNVETVEMCKATLESLQLPFPLAEFVYWRISWSNTWSTVRKCQWAQFILICT